MFLYDFTWNFTFFHNLLATLSQYFRTLLYIMESDAVKNTAEHLENENDSLNLAGDESENAVNDNGKYNFRKTIIKCIDIFLEASWSTTYYKYQNFYATLSSNLSAFDEQLTEEDDSREVAVYEQIYFSESDSDESEVEESRGNRDVEINNGNETEASKYQLRPQKGSEMTRYVSIL